MAFASTWSGNTDANFNTSANWDAAPTNGSALVFDVAGTAGTTLNNDISGLSITTLTYNSTASAYTIGGNALTITSGITNNATAAQILNTNIALGAASAWALGAGSSTTLGGIVSGGFGITKTGTGNLTLNGANTYSGDTLVSAAGTIKLGSSSVGIAGTVGSNGTLSSGALGTGANRFGGTSSNGIVLDLNGKTYANRFVYMGGGTFTLDNTSATTASVTGAMDGAINTSSVNVISNFIVGGNNGDIDWTGKISRTSGTLGMTKAGSNTVTFKGSSANAGVGTVTVNAGTLGLGMTGTSAGAFATAVTVNSGGTLKFRPDLGTVSGGSAWGGQINSTISLNNGATLDLFGSSGQNSRVQQINDGTTPGGTVTNTSSTAATLGIASRDTNTTQTFSGVIQDGTGTVAVDFTNSGTLNSGRVNLFKGNNTYSGGTNVAYGTFRLGHANAAGTGTVTVAASGLGSGRTALEFDTTNAGSTSFSLGGLAGSAAFALNDFSTTTTGIALTLGGNNTSNTHSGVISGPGSLIKTGTGAQTINGANSYSGGTTVKNGTLATTNATGFGTGTITIGDSSGSNSAGISVNSANNTIANNIVIASGSSGTASITTNQGGGTTTTFSGNIALNKDLTINTSSSPGSVGHATYTGAITGTGNLTVDSGNNFAPLTWLKGANNFTGDVSIKNTTTLGTVNGALGSANAVTIDSSSQLNTQGQNLTIAGLNGSGTVVVSNAAQTLTLGGSGTYSYGGVIQNSGSLTKSGSGTQTLSGANTYTGATTVQSGVLALGANNVFSDSSNFVLSGGTVNVGSFSDTVGTLSLGGNASISLSGGSFAFADSSALNWGSNTLSISGTFVSGASLRFGTSSGGLTSGQLSLINIGSGLTAGLDSNGFLIAAIPEPSTFGLLAGMGALGLVGLRRRRVTR